MVAGPDGFRAGADPALDGKCLLRRGGRFPVDRIPVHEVCAEPIRCHEGDATRVPRPAGLSGFWNRNAQRVTACPSQGLAYGLAKILRYVPRGSAVMMHWSEVERSKTAALRGSLKLRVRKPALAPKAVTLRHAEKEMPM